METREPTCPTGLLVSTEIGNERSTASHSTGGQEAVVPTWGEPDKSEERETMAKPTITCPTQTGSQLGVSRQCSTTDTQRAFI